MALSLSPSTLALLSDSHSFSESDNPARQLALSTYHNYPHLTLIPIGDNFAVLLGLNPREYLGVVGANLPALLRALANENWKQPLTIPPPGLTMAILPDIKITL